MSQDKSLQNLLNEALEHESPVERARFLDEACGADAALRERVEKLLRAHDEAGGFFSQPSKSAAPASGAVALPVTEKPGDKIGRYKLLQQIGEGGCGVVYMAEQEEPVRRRVALKVIKLGMDTKQVIARFEAERQALAMMDHPNIARVLDAGATESGRPFFVMELVRGTKLTEFCDQEQLSTKERLELFIAVCQAVQHAHQKGIIHRDLKPSNILVTTVDGGSVPKVIDFGIAKATNNQPLTDRTLFTAFEQFIGTPAYMSPEQAEMSGVDIDTRSDIYSLGVLLYELLTGSPPFDQKELLAAGLDGMRRIIRETEPPRPSNRLSTMTADLLTATALHRHTESLKLTHLVRGDLDWIAMKCLEKDRARRYETANALAADIRRHLVSEPVVARPPSRLYEFQKTVRRHKFGFAAATAVILALAVGLGISTWTLVKEKQTRERAVAAEQQAQSNATKAEREAKRAEQNATEAQARRKQAVALAEENRLNLYAARIKLTAQAIAEGDVSHAHDLLDALRPQDGQEDLRSFDWYYLHQLASNEKLALSRVGGRVRSVAYSPDGRLLAAASDDRLVRLWDAATYSLRAQLRGHSREVTAVAFGPDGTLASAGADGTVRIWDVASAEQLHSLQLGTNGLAVLAFSPDGSRLAVAEGATGNTTGNPFTRYAKPAGPGRVLVWNTKTLEIESVLDAHCCGALALGFSPDGQLLATGGIEASLKIFRVATGQELLVQTNFDGPVFAVRFLPDQELAVASWNPYKDSGRITVLDAVTLEQKRVMLSAGKVTCLGLSPDGRVLAAAGPDRVLRLRDVATGQETGVFNGHTAEIWSLAFSPDGRTLATGGFDDAIRIWNVTSHPARQRIAVRHPFSLAFSPDGSLLACSGQTIDIRNAQTGALLKSLPGYAGGDVRVSFSPDGSVLAATDNLEAVHFWNVQTWNHWTPAKEDLAARPRRGTGPVETQFAFSPDGTTLARAGWDQVIRLWNVRSGRLVSTISQSAFSVAFTPDGKLISAGDGGNLSVWNTETRELEHRLPDSGGLLRISKNGRWVATGTAGRISIRELSDLPVMRALHAHREAIYCINFSHDGKILASASWDGTVKLWQVATGQELFTIPSLSGVVWTVAFSPDDRTLAFGSSGGALGESGEINILRCASPEKISTQTEELTAANDLRDATVLTRQGNRLRDAGDLAGAQAAFRAALDLRQKRLSRDDPAMPDAIFNLANVLERAGKFAQAEPLYRELLEWRRARLASDDPNLAASLAFMASTLVAQEKFAEAEPFARESLVIRETKLPDDWRTFNTQSTLGRSLLGQGKYSEAESLLLSGVAGLEQRLNQPGAKHRFLAEAIQSVIALYENTGRRQQAAELTEKLRAISTAAESAMPARR